MMPEETDQDAKGSSEAARAAGRRWFWGVALAVILFVVYPGVRWFVFGRGKASTSTEQSAQAVALLDESLRHYQAKRYKDCLTSALQSAKLDPSSARAFNNAGICAGNLQLWDEAMRNTEEAIRLDPSLQLARNNLEWIRQEKTKADATQVK
jgi:tetratricopeptide (TPR) repeat protein